MGWRPVTSASSWQKAEVSFDPINILETGYVFVYLSYENESNNYVYFDDLKVTHTKTNVVQYNEYYPFGLQAATSWTRENTTGNRFLYNEGTELNGISGIYETMFRGYDASVGRFMQVDPLAALDNSTSPFAYAGNNPLMFNDPTGLLINVNGYGDDQIRMMYRSDRGLGRYNGNFDEWAVDNLDPNSFGGGGRMIQGTDGRKYGSSDGQLGYWFSDGSVTATGDGSGGVVVTQNKTWVPIRNDDSGWDLDFYGIVPVITSPWVDDDAAFTPGPVVIKSPTIRQSSEDRKLIRHEVGHAVTFLVIGPALYIITIAIPSVWSFNNDPKNHPSFYTEKIANTISEWIYGPFNDPKGYPSYNKK